MTLNAATLGGQDPADYLSAANLTGKVPAANLSLATQPEAEVGTGEGLMTAVRTRQAIDAQNPQFQSGEIPVSEGQEITLAHGLPEEPMLVACYLVPQVPIFGVAPGTHIHFSAGEIDDSTGLAVVTNSSGQIKLTVGSRGMSIARPDTGARDRLSSGELADFRLLVRAR